MPSSPPTFSLQYTLPRLPVPSLEETCAVYLKSLIPLQTPKEHEKTKAIVQDFLKGDLSKSLQQRLIDIDRASPTNWLEDNFWLKKGKKKRFLQLIKHHTLTHLFISLFGMA
jgi:carnitine O-acetyltransferase